MIIYRNHYYTNELGSEGYIYFASKRLAVKSFNEYKRNNAPGVIAECAERLEIETTKRGIISFLNRFAGHADNG